MVFYVNFYRLSMEICQVNSFYPSISCLCQVWVQLQELCQSKEDILGQSQPCPPSIRKKMIACESPLQGNSCTLFIILSSQPFFFLSVSNFLSRSLFLLLLQITPLSISLSLYLNFSRHSSLSLFSLVISLSLSPVICLSISHHPSPFRHYPSPLFLLMNHILYIDL